MLLSSPLLFMDITNDTVDSSLEHRIWGTLTHLLGGLTALFSGRVRADDHLSGQQHGGESLGISDKSSKLCWSDLPVPCCQVCHTDDDGYGLRRTGPAQCTVHVSLIRYMACYAGLHGLRAYRGMA